MSVKPMGFFALAWTLLQTLPALEGDRRYAEFGREFFGRQVVVQQSRGGLGLRPDKLDGGSVHVRPLHNGRSGSHKPK
jgi:hypothetical protein